MKLDKQTIDILNSLKVINPGLIFKAGNVLKTKHVFGSMPVVKVEFKNVQFPTDFAIYDIGRFLTLVTMLNDAELQFTDTHVLVSDQSGRSAQIKFAEPRTIVSFNYESEVKMPSIDYQFELSAENHKYLMKALSALSAPEIAFVGDGSKISVVTCDSKNSGIDSFSIEVGKTEHRFKMIINAVNLSLLNRPYIVKGSFKGLVEFYSSDDHNTLQYWITVSEKSKVENA